jgi:hypothetical protein
LDGLKRGSRLKSIPLTQWINAAIAEKLDRENPETNVPDSEYVPALVELSPAERYKLEKLKAEQTALAASLAAFERARRQGCASDGRAAPAVGASGASGGSGGSGASGASGGSGGSGSKWRGCGFLGRG